MIFWTGWLLKASADSGKWRKRFFRVRDNKLEYLESGAGEDGAAASASTSTSTAASTAASTDAGAATTRAHRRAASTVSDVGEDAAQEDARAATKHPQPPRGNIRRVVTSESNLSQDSSDLNNADDENANAASTSGNAKQGPRARNAESGLKDWAVAREVGEAPRGFLNLDEVAGFFVFGKLRTDPVLDHHVQLCSLRHAQFHQGKVKLLLCGRSGRPSWRLALGDDCSADIHKFFTCVERSLTRSTVLAAGWVVSPGTINYNRRYVLLLSTGRLLIFKDASLDNLRRELWLGEAGCAILPVRDLPRDSVGSAGERGWLDALAKAHDSSKLYCELTAIRIVHPALTDKKGYLLAIERLSARESAAAHGARFREWLRVLKNAVLVASLQHQRLRNLPAQFEDFSRKMVALRSAEESKQCLERMVLAKDLLPCPALVELARAGLVDALRTSVWKGICQRVAPRWTRPPSDALQVLPRARTPGFSVPLASAHHHGWSSGALDKLCADYPAPVRKVVERLIAREPQAAISPELIRMAYFVTEVLKGGCADTDATRGLEAVVDDAGHILEVLVLGPYWAYHGATDPVALVISHLIDSTNLDRVAKAKARARSAGAVSGGAALQIDTQIVLDIVRDLCPSFPDALLEASRPTVRTWLRSVFADRTPFGSVCKRRLWDLLVVELDSDDEMHLRDRSVQIAVASVAMASRAAPLELTGLSIDAWTRALSTRSGDEAETLENPGAQELGNDQEDAEADEMRADAIIFAVTRDRELLRATRWTLLKERRSQLWNSLEVESRESAGLVNRWTATARSLDDLTHSILDTLNKINAEEAERDRKLVARLSSPVHAALLPLTSLLQELMEALNFAKVSLLQLTTRSAQASPALYTGTKLDRILDEATGCSNLFFSAAGQAAVNPMLVSGVAKATVALGWAMAAACDECIAFADTMAFHRVRMLARSVPIPHLAGLVEADFSSVIGPGKGEGEGAETLGGPSSESVSGVATVSRDSDGSEGKRRASTASNDLSDAEVDLDGDDDEVLALPAKVLATVRDAASPGAQMPSPTRRRTSPDFRSKSLSYSLSGVARLVRPAGDPKEAAAPLAQRVYDELCRLLHSLLIHLDDMAQCMVDTSVSSQRRRSEQSPLTACTVHPDPFGGRIQPLARLVPFLVRTSDLIRSQALFADAQPVRASSPKHARTAS